MFTQKPKPKMKVNFLNYEGAYNNHIHLPWNWKLGSPLASMVSMSVDTAVYITFLLNILYAHEIHKKFVHFLYEKNIKQQITYATQCAILAKTHDGWLKRTHNSINKNQEDSSVALIGHIS